MPRVYFKREGVPSSTEAGGHRCCPSLVRPPPKRRVHNDPDWTSASKYRHRVAIRTAETGCWKVPPAGQNRATSTNCCSIPPRRMAHRSTSGREGSGAGRKSPGAPHGARASVASPWVRPREWRQAHESGRSVAVRPAGNLKIRRGSWNEQLFRVSKASRSAMTTSATRRSGALECQIRE